MQFGKSKARVQMEPSTQVTFTDVAGIEGAKLELTEVVDFLKNPDRFTAVGSQDSQGCACLSDLLEQVKPSWPRLWPAKQGFPSSRFQVLNSSRCSSALVPAASVISSNRPRKRPLHRFY